MPNLINTNLAQNFNRANHANSNYGTRRLQFFQIEIAGYDITNEPNWDNADKNSVDRYDTVYRSEYGGVEYQESRKSILYPVLRGVAQIGEIMYNGLFGNGTGPNSGNTYVIIALSMDTVASNGSSGFRVNSKGLESAIIDSIADFEYDAVNVTPIWHDGNQIVTSVGP